MPDDDNPYAPPPDDAERTQAVPPPGQEAQQPQQPTEAQQPPYGQPQYGQAQYGQQYPQAYGAVAPFPQTSGKATGVLVLGIASLAGLFVCLIGVVPAIIALVMAPGAYREIEQSGGRLVGEGQVRGGKICAWITIGLTALAVLGLVIFFVAVAATDSNGWDSGY